MSSSEMAIQVRGVSKKYRIGAKNERYYTLRDQLSRMLTAPYRMFAGRSRVEPKFEEFWALQDVSFEVKRGEVVGIIGRNGAGKSTLLKILSRITEPTKGEIDLLGRVGSLLEVGTGFHPELTGRENIYLNGAILGMKRSEIVRKFDEIVEFAEVEKFIDTPVKYYSSGMYMRLAFAVAAHLEPEILVVDEVLAVGDAQFQKKCLGKMGEVAKAGRTVLFVSHNMSAVLDLCSSGILLERGRIVEVAPVTQVVSKYFVTSQGERSYRGTPTVPIGLVAADLVVNDTDANQNMELHLEIVSDRSVSVAIDVRLSDSIGNPVAYGSLGAFAEEDLVPLQPGLNRVTTRHNISLLATGLYQISIDLTRPDIEYLERVENCLSFECSAPPRRSGGKRIQQAWNKGCWELPTVAVSTGHSGVSENSRDEILKV